MACAPAPSNVTVFEPGVNVPPLLVQSPAAVILVPAVRVPALNSVLPFMSSVAGAVKLPSVIVRLLVVMLVVLPPVLSAFAPLLLTVKLLKVWLEAVPLIDWLTELPSKVTVPEPGVKVPPLLVQLPAAVMLVPAVRFPAVNNVLPFISRVAGAVKLPSVIVRSLTVSVVGLTPVD